MGDGIDLLGCFESFKAWLAAAVIRSVSLKVAEEMLLCEVIVQHAQMHKTAGLREASISGAAAADRLLRYSSVYVRFVCDLAGKQGMVDERIALLEEMYTRICEENGPADPVLQGIVSRWRS
jgi:hypothetical protein